MHVQDETIKIIVTMGDPHGIGPELCAKLASDKELLHNIGAAITVIGSMEILQKAAKSADIPRTHMNLVDKPSGNVETIDVIEPESGDYNTVTEEVMGATAESGKASVKYIEKGVKYAIDGDAHAIVTCPVSKEALKMTGCKYPGHTEMLGALCGCPHKPIMMMLSDHLKVAFVTTHVAIKDISNILSEERVAGTSRIFAHAMVKYFNVKHNKLALCAFNPHAGDGGRFGNEEAAVLQPAIEKLNDEGLHIEGPLPADTLFYKALEGDYNGIIAIYHDQGMIPAKMYGPDKVVNITLGLPIIRTSPAHGTAYDIAGRGIANAGSFVKAVKTAVGMVKTDRMNEKKA